MKKIFYFCILLFLFAACATPKLPSKREILISFFDFRDFTEKGFFISPNAYSAEHKPYGEISILIYPAKNLKTEGIVPSDELYSHVESERKFLVEEKISPNELLEIIVNEAKQKGADALVNFRCKRIYTSFVSKGITHEHFSHYLLEGFAIKRGI